MGFDLNRAFEEAAERGTAHRPDLAPGPVLQRIRRRRTVRTASASAVGVAAAGAVAVGGLQLAERGAAPPAGPTGTTTPAPSPSAGVTPPWAEGLLPACGEESDLLAPTPGGAVGDAWAQVGVIDADGGAFLPEGYGDHLLLGFELTGTGTATVDDVVETGRAVVTRDGVVVATFADAEWTRQDPTTTGFDPDALSYGERLVELVDCADGSYPGAGSYVLWTASVVRTPEGRESVVHAPVSFTVFGFEDPDNLGDVRWTPDGPVDPRTGEPVDPTPDDGAPVGAPPLRDLTFRPNGIDGVPLGLEAPGGIHGDGPVRWEPEACPGTDRPGRVVPVHDDVEDARGGLVPPFVVRSLEDRVVRVDVVGRGLVTSEGIGVGSTLAALRAAHGVELLAEAGELGPFEAWGTTGGGRTWVFEVASDGDGGADVWSSAQKGTVVAMAAMQGTSYDSAALGSTTCD